VADPTRSTQTQIAVTQPPVASITVTPAAPSVIEGAALTLSAVAHDTLDAPLSPQPSSFAWTSSAPEVAAVDDAGLLTAARAGSTLVTASAGGITSAGDMVVVQPPAPTVHVTAALATARAGDPPV